MRKRMLGLLVGCLLAVLFAGCGNTAASGMKLPTGQQAAKGQTGRMTASVKLADLGRTRSRGGYADAIDYTLTQGDMVMSRRVVFDENGIAVIDETLAVGNWTLTATLSQGAGNVLTGTTQFAIVAGQTTQVALVLTQPSGSAAISVTVGGFQMGDLTSDDGDKLFVEGQNRFTWTPKAGGTGATWCRLYISQLGLLSNGADGNYVPCDVTITNFDANTMGVMPASNTQSDGTTLTRTTAINAKPGVTVKFSLGVVPWPPYFLAEYNRVQFARVDNGTPAGYRVVGTLPVYSVGKG